MTKEEALSLLKEQLLQIDLVRKQGFDSKSFDKWHRDTAVVIGKLFGQASDHVSQFHNISYKNQEGGWVDVGRRISSGFLDGLNKAKSLLDSMITEVEKFWEDTTVEKANTSIKPERVVFRICDKFHAVVRRLRKRHDERTTLDVQDEYDVQDLLSTLLLLFFEDIRPEEWTPSYAGSCSRVDFLLKREKIVLETKIVRKGLTDKQIGEQLIIDIEKYKNHPDCKTLICFVYDPEGRISNPRGLEKDLNRDGELIVRVLIRPM